MAKPDVQEEKHMLTIERNEHSVIVYDEEEGKGIAFPTTADKDVNLYVQELKERAQVIKPGTTLVPLLLYTRYSEISTPMQLSSHTILGRAFFKMTQRQ